MSLNSLQSMTVPGIKNTAGTEIYTDLNSLQNLKSSARKDADAALPEVARQFEAVMLSMMIKNLRKTGMEDPLFNSQAMDSYRDMYDQQLGLELSKGQGIGFAKAIVEQMRYQSGQQSAVMNQSELSAGNRLKRRHFPDHYMKAEKPLADPVADIVQAVQAGDKISPDFASPAQFVEKLWPLAEDAGREIGVSAEIILSQAALETGWGKYIINDGQHSSYNLFNIKAGQDWSGGRMEKLSREFLPGKSMPIQEKSHFRAYDSFAQSFTDYVDFIKNNPRYNSYSGKNTVLTDKTEQSLHDEYYIKGIHQAGYATDPVYADKVLRVLNSEPVQNQRLKQIKLAEK